MGKPKLSSKVLAECINKPLVVKKQGERSTTGHLSYILIEVKSIYRTLFIFCLNLANPWSLIVRFGIIHETAVIALNYYC